MLGRYIYIGSGRDVIGCRCICDVIGWSCGRLMRENRLGTDGGAVCDFGSVIVRVVSRRWFGQATSIIWVGDVRVAPWS